MHRRPSPPQYMASRTSGFGHPQHVLYGRGSAMHLITHLLSASGGFHILFVLQWVSTK